MGRILAINSNTYHGYPLEDAVRGIADAGFRYIELTATKGWTEHVYPDHSLRQLFRVQDMLKDAGLTPFAMSGHTNLTDPARAGDFRDNIRLASFFGSRYIVSSIGEAHLKDGHVADLDETVRCIASFVPELKARDMTLVLETHGYDHGTGKILSDVVDRVGSEYVRINYDTANVIFYGRTDPAADLAACVDNVAYLHIKDKAGPDDVWDFPAPGKGRIDFDAVFDTLRRAGNGSPFSVEIEFTPEGPKNLAEVDQAVRDSAAFFRSKGFSLEG